jgi:hypothetical protein
VHPAAHLQQLLYLMAPHIAPCWLSLWHPFLHSCCCCFIPVAAAAAAVASFLLLLLRLLLLMCQAVANYTSQILGDVRPYPEIFANFLTKLLNYHFILRR